MAAKLSDLRLAQSIFITQAVADELGDDYQRYGDAHRPIWSRLHSVAPIGGRYVTVYGTNVHWAI